MGPFEYDSTKPLEATDAVSKTFAGMVGQELTVVVSNVGKVKSISGLDNLTSKLIKSTGVKEEAETEKRHHEFTDPDERFRNRSLDLTVNPEVRGIFRTRARIISFIRNYLDARGFLEVETPVLQPLYGGGTARPFSTYHNQLKKQLYLRIADELYLKRLIIGGLDRVYEIAKDFRNEGVDRTHNPEFTMMECYIAFEDYHYHLELVESMTSSMVKEICGGWIVSYNKTRLDFTCLLYTSPSPRD